VPSSTRKILSRISRMNAEEVTTRVRQECGKRLDWLLYAAGYRSAIGGNSFLSSSGQFFFSEADLPPLIDSLKTRLPFQAQKIVLDAEAICVHKFNLLGYENLDFGSQIDWHLDPVHGKKSPLAPWFKIDFLNFETVGDHKIIWELNRHQHLLTLAKAWHLTGAERFVKEIVLQFYDWQRANPYPLGINWASTLEVALRSLSWIWLKYFLEGCPVAPARFKNDLAGALAFNAGYIERFLSTYFSPNTHLIGEAVALFFIGTLFASTKRAVRWRGRGWKIVLEEAQRQVRPDGVYFEQSLYYHVYALDFFLHARQLAVQNRMQVPPSLDAALNRMLDVIQALCQAGPPEGFGDDDGGRLFDPQRNRTEHMADPLALGAMMFGRFDLPSAVLTEEALWLGGNKAIAHFRGSVADRPTASCAFRDGGIYVVASEEKLAQQMTIDAGPQGTGRAGHGHADALSVCVSLSGQRFLTDSGTGCYICRGDTRNRLRETGAHNTVQVAGTSQAVPDGPFAWSSIPHVTVADWIAGKTFTFFAGHHDGYARLPAPVIHRRDVLHIPGAFWFVREALTGRSMHDVEIAWHAAPGMTVERLDNGWQLQDSAASLAIVPLADENWSHEQQPYEASPAYGKLEAGLKIISRARVQLPAEYATVLKPSLDRAVPGKLHRIEGSKSAACYRYDDGERSHLLIFSAQAGPWSCLALTSDARLVYAMTDAGVLQHLVFCHGTYVEYNGKEIVRHPQKKERFEWDARKGTTKTFSSDTKHPVS